MFKICNDKTYYVVQTTSEDVVVEIYTKKDGRGSDISLHEMHLDLCRAIRKLQHDGYTIMKVYPAMGDRRESIDVLSMPEFIQSAKCPDNDVEEAVVFSYFESGATFQLPCKVNKETHEIFDVTCAAMPCDDDCFSYAEVEINGKDYLYGCFLQVVMKAKLAEANILLMSPGCKITENQWHKIKPILEGALEKEGPDVDVIVCLSNDDNVIRVRCA